MSTFYDRADQLKAYLERVVGLESVVWVVDRQKDLAAEFTKAISKKRGLGLITWTGGRNNDRDAKALRIASRVNITLFFKPIIRWGDPAGDDVCELTARAIHHWSPADTPTKHLTRFEVTDIDSIDNPQFLCFRISCESVTQCPSTPIPTIP